MIKAIIFDFFGVICSDEYWRSVHTDRQAKSVFRDYGEEVNLGQVSWESFVKKLAVATNASVDAVQEMYAREQIDPRLVELIADLHKDYKTGLITNAHHDFIDQLLEKSYMRPLFDAVTISSRVGITKPDPDIFERTLEQLGIEPSEAIYIDDLERHVEGAKGIGMQAIVYRDFSQMQDELNQILSHY